MIFARQKSKWGVGAGVTIAVVWNSLNLFVTHNMQTGAAASWSLLRPGQMRELVPMLVMLGGIGHFVLSTACLAAPFYRRIKDKKLWKMVAGGVVALAYFALIVIVARPR